MIARPAALLLCCTASAAAAQPRLDATIGDHAVLQRDRPIFLSGAADPGERLTLTLGPGRAIVRADRQGRWQATLPAMPAGGPYRLTATGTNGTAIAEDVMLGDVFLCSGQSNMELSVAHAQDAEGQIAAAADPDLRLFTITRRSALAPQPTLGETSGWLPAAPASAAGFSAACFAMAKDLRAGSDVAIGAIHASWGGSRISAWMDDRALAAADLADAVRLRSLYARDPGAAARAFGIAWERWWRAGTGDRPGGEPWQQGAALDWKRVPAIGFWEDWGDPALTAFNGMVWYRRVVTLTAAQARQPATLAIGRVDEADQSWVNAVPVGAAGNPQALRTYPLSPGVLREGRNVIVVNALDTYAKGGLTGPAEAMRLSFADGTAVPLGDGWDYAREGRRPAAPPRAPWEDTAGAGTLHAGMIAPLGRIGLKGVAWYQGESDVDIPGYARRLRALMAGWRAQFGAPDLPFAIVQLPGYGAPAGAVPGESGWAALRDEQRRAVAADGHAALAVAIDLGDPLELHPGQKREVGRRLARAMRHLAYGGAEPPSGPAIASARRTPDGVTLAFTGVTGALAPRAAGQAIGFELCGDTPGSCRFAPGIVSGATVMLPADGRPITRIRYGWADTPVVNLFDAAGLPAGPFEIAVAP